MNKIYNVLHVLGVNMYVRLTSSKKSKHPTLQIVEGVREGKKVKQKIIASLGVIREKKDLEKLRNLAQHLIEKLEKEGLPPDGKVSVERLMHEETVYNGFGAVVDRLMNLSRFSNILQKAQGRKHFDFAEIIKLTITQRMHLPSSKLRTYERQEEHGYREFDLQHFYRAMDAIEPLAEEFQKQALKTANEYAPTPLDCFFFDVTTLYFESVKQDELKDFGFSKDQKYHTVQIVLALVVDSQGIPVAYEVFRGNLAETKTFIPVLETLRNRFSINNVTIVCDRGMASKSNVEALQQKEFCFVLATKLKSISKKNKINDKSKYTPLPDQENIPKEEQIQVYTMPHPQYENTLLIATYSPHRAKKDKEDRDRLIEKLKEKLGDTPDETSVKKVISNSGYKKFTNVGKDSVLTLNQEAIDEEALWDGYHGIAVSNNANLSVTDALARYKGLWRVEEAFRVAKCTLKTRPIFHRTPHRIRSHVLICFINLFLERFLELLLRQNQMPLTPDRIRQALLGVHTVIFKERETQKRGSMSSALSEDAHKIFTVLGLSLERNTELNSVSCV
ncbi:MAG: IS1634 family transposase [Chlamydiae bacterium]|nr:IS1634 family transposase [Chlamydiota bacterium]